MATKAKPKAEAPAEVRAPTPPLPPVMPPELLGEIPLAQIRACPFNLRKSFPDEDIAGLADSIRTEGLLNRLIVRPVGLPGEAPTFAGKWSGLSHYEYAAALELFDGPNTDTAKELLDFAELDWEQLQEQARRELSGEEPAEAKIAKAEAEQAADPDEPQKEPDTKAAGKKRKAGAA